MLYIKSLQPYFSSMIWPIPISNTSNIKPLQLFQDFITRAIWNFCTPQLDGNFEVQIQLKKYQNISQNCNLA